MKVKVLFFASSREITGVSSIDLELEEGTTTENLKKLINQYYPGLSFEKNINLKLAVNRKYCTEDTILHDRDEIAVIPPIAGG